MKQKFAIIPCRFSWGGAFNRRAFNREGAGVSSLSKGSPNDGCRVGSAEYHIAETVILPGCENVDTSRDALVRFFPS